MTATNDRCAECGQAEQYHLAGLADRYMGGTITDHAFVPVQCPTCGGGKEEPEVLYPYSGAPWPCPDPYHAKEGSDG